MVGRLVIPGAPYSSWLCGLDWMKPWSVFTTSTVANPRPSGMLAGACHCSVVALCDVGVNGPCATVPAAVAMNTFTTVPAVNPTPPSVLSAPTTIGDGIGFSRTIGAGVFVGSGALVRVGVRVGGTGVFVGSGSLDGVGDDVLNLPTAFRIAQLIA